MSQGKHQRDKKQRDQTQLKSEMCNRSRLVIDYQIDTHFFLSNRNRAFLQNSNRNRNPVKKILV